MRLPRRTDWKQIVGHHPSFWFSRCNGQFCVNLAKSSGASQFRSPDVWHHGVSSISSSWRLMENLLDASFLVSGCYKQGHSLVYIAASLQSLPPSSHVLPHVYSLLQISTSHRYKSLDLESTLIQYNLMLTWLHPQTLFPNKITFASTCC